MQACIKCEGLINHNGCCCYEKELEEKNKKLEEELQKDTEIFIQEIVLCPDEKLSPKAKEIKHKIIEMVLTKQENDGIRI